MQLNYVSPEILRMPAEIIDELKDKGIPQAEYNSLEAVLAETDVLYVTRVQKERFDDPDEYESGQGRLRHHARDDAAGQRAHDRDAPAAARRRDQHGSG